ncbi:MAG: S-methyl-5'-thioinosine phosphorylase [Capsulimonadales bacterium]|nr:S-methyl-5'-thioinosine phosphorylase [Capsulimonadales bacterium]
MIAIIGGTGVNDFPLEGEPEPLTVVTRWGETRLRRGIVRGRTVFFLARHGAGHRVPPHAIPYRANIAALVKLGVRAVLATTAVGGLKPTLMPGTLLLPEDLIDFTRERTGKTFFDGKDGVIVHADMTRPYSEPLRELVRTAADTLGTPIVPEGVYLCNDGPRYETAAEVRLFGQVWGADVAGMTGVPETFLAREAGLHYATISVVTNPGAGLQTGLLTHAEVETAFRNALPQLVALIGETIGRTRTELLPPIGPGVPIPL